jgi:hypothetical protein
MSTTPTTTPSPPSPDDLLTTSECALLLGISPNRVLQLIHAHDLLPARQLGAGAHGDWLIARSALEAYSRLRLARLDAVRARASQVLTGLVKYGSMDPPTDFREHDDIPMGGA